LTAEEFNQFKGLTEDAVILKFKAQNPSKPLPCIPAARKPPATGERLWGIGYPSEAKRMNGLSSDGHSQYVTMGLVRDQITRDPVLMSISQRLGEKERELFWKRESEIWMKPSILISSNDLMTGNSGGSLINSQGELVSIAFGTTLVDEKKATGANVYSMRIDKIRERIQTELGRQKADEIFDCPGESAQ
jgi:hypothetical protein